MFVFRFSAIPLLLSAAIPACSDPPADSPFGKVVPGIFGQLRARTEWDGKALADTSLNQALQFTHLRSRLAYTSVGPDGFTYRFEAQDSRYMGSEPASANPATASVGNAKGLDLLQAYATFAHRGFAGTLGRQKLSLGSGRFISTLEWSASSRAFDGISFNWSQGTGNLTSLAFLVRDSSDRQVDDRLLLTGLFYNRALTPLLKADAYLFYDQARIGSVYSGFVAQNYDLIYMGGRVAGRTGLIAFEGELIRQSGEVRAGRDLASEAFQVALRVGLVFPDGKVDAGVDAMSGDDDPSDDEANGYRANYWFAHAYYGWMDYFVNNPARGVVDLRMDGEYGFSGAGRTKLRAQYHWFLPQKSSNGSGDAYGQEVDLEIQFGLGAKAQLLIGGGVFVPGDDAASLPSAAVAKDQNSRLGFLAYCMPAFNF